ncbi:hypothetical protein [Catenuloplanes atrovinosus]|uniref:ATP/GTP-binding protein n=1 Tax=Catenuloplanes atrovinosus TaxID=137266 RepID=A0AAE3YUG9_9ACTN|nr:hypothetical protein [Catenuloplanes atrovinosus]MDR7278867.1 hypothetical protein [Catenuloplanes atrovinosus]
MLTRRTRVRLALATLLAGVLATTGLMLVRGPDVYAAPPECHNTPDSTECSIGDETTIPGDGNGNNPGGGGGGGTGTCSWRGQEVDCYVEGAGYFNGNDGCYYRMAEPQPAGVPEGKTRYLKSCLDNPGAQSEEDLDAPPDVFVPDPAAVAADIATRIVIPVPEAELSPAGAGVLGLPVWMRIRQDTAWPDAPISRTESVAGLTVTVTATPVRAEWDMGDGVGTVVCTGRGEAWSTDKGTGRSPSCGYPMAGSSLPGYQRASNTNPGGAPYQVRVRTSWDLAWTTTTSGSGVLPGVTTEYSTTAYVVNELQVVNR